MQERISMPFSRTEHVRQHVEQRRVRSRTDRMRRSIHGDLIIHGRLPRDGSDVPSKIVPTKLSNRWRIIKAEGIKGE